MLNLDMSKALPREAFEYLVAFLPGLFFEFSILFANPQLIESHLNAVQNSVRVPPYLVLAVALFFAFIIGAAFMMLMSYAQHLHCSIQRWWLRACVMLDRTFSRTLSNAAQKYPSLRQSSLFQRFFRYASLIAQRHLPRTQLGMRAWREVARKLLHDRYGVEINLLHNDWELFFWNLGSPSALDYRGPLLVMALHATGWSGIASTTLAPALWNRYYLALCALLILFGLHSDHVLALRKTRPEGITAIQLRALLREFDRQVPVRLKAQDAVQNPQEPARE